MKKTGFFWDEKCFWHSGGNYALTMPVGDFVQPLAAGGLPENPETKRRLKNLIDVSGLLAELEAQSAPAASTEELARVHPKTFLKTFKQTSDNGGGELGLRTPFGQGGYEIAALSAGLAIHSLAAVLKGELKNAYSLSRPPGHHCLPDFPNGFCLLANISVAIEAAIANGLGKKFVVLDWDVHHGNGTEAIFYDRDDVLTISMHQDKNYPPDTGQTSDKGKNAGQGFNINIPLPPGSGDATYHYAMEQIAAPAISNFDPDVIIVACGFDASPFDPLAHMLVTADGFRSMTKTVMDLAATHCDGKLLLVHEGGYSEAYVPFCGHAVIAELAQSDINAGDPVENAVTNRQPSDRVFAFHRELIDEMAIEHGIKTGVAP